MIIIIALFAIIISTNETEKVSPMLRGINIFV